MSVKINKELAALRRMTASELRAKYEELFGEEARSGNRQWLFRRIAWRMQASGQRSRNCGVIALRSVDSNTVSVRSSKSAGLGSDRRLRPTHSITPSASRSTWSDRPGERP